MRSYRFWKRTFGILAMCWLGFNLHGQNFKSDLSALRKKYEGNISMNIQTRIISTDPAFKELNLKGQIKVKGKEMFYKQGEDEVLYTKHYLLVVSHSEKSIILDTADDEYNAAPLNVLHLDSLITSYQSVTYSNAGGEKQYTLVPKQGEIASYILTIGATGLLEKAQINLKAEAGGGSAIITYSEILLNPSFTAEDFSITRYLKKQGSKFVLQDAYKAYTLDSAI